MCDGTPRSGYMHTEDDSAEVPDLDDFVHTSSNTTRHIHNPSAALTTLEIPSKAPPLHHGTDTEQSPR